MMCLQERVSEAQRLAKMVILLTVKLYFNINFDFLFHLQNMKDMGEGKKGKRGPLDDDEEGAMGVRKKNIGKHNKSNRSKKFKKK